MAVEQRTAGARFSRDLDYKSITRAVPDALSL